MNKQTVNVPRSGTEQLTTFALCLGLLLGLVIGAGVARVVGWGSL